MIPQFLIPALAFSLLFPVLAASAAPQARPQIKPAPRPKIAFRTFAPDAAATTQLLVRAATAAKIKTLTSDADRRTREQLLEALALLGQPEIALRFANGEDEDQIWRETAQIQAQLGEIALAERALAKIEGDDVQQFVLMAMARAQLRKNDRAGARKTILRAEKLLVGAESERDLYAYIADLWRRAGDGAAALRLLRAIPKEQFPDRDATRDHLEAAQYFALRAGGNLGLKLETAPHRLVLDAIRVMCRGGHYERAAKIVAARKNAWERAVLLGEMAFYERALTSQNRFTPQFEAAAQSALQNVAQIKKMSDWNDDWPLSIALSLAQLGKLDAAENFATQAQKHRDIIEKEDWVGQQDWTEALSDDYTRPLIWPRLDAARRAALQEAALAPQVGFDHRLRLFLGLRFSGDDAGARKFLDAAIEKLEIPSADGERGSNAIDFLLAAQFAREKGQPKRAGVLADAAIQILRSDGAKPWKIASDLIDRGLVEKGVALAFKNPPPRGEFESFHWLAYNDATARDLKSVPDWIKTMRNGVNKVDALSGFVAGQERNRPDDFINEEDEYKMEFNSTSIFTDTDYLNLRWQDLPFFPKIAREGPL